MRALGSGLSVCFGVRMYVCVCACVCLSVCNYACVRLRTYVQATPDPLGLDRTLRRFGGL